MVSIGLLQCLMQSFARVIDQEPRFNIGGRIADEIHAAAGGDQCHFIGKVTIDRDAADVRLLGNVSKRGRGQALGLVQFNRGFNDSLSSIVLSLGTLSEFVSSFHFFMIHTISLKLTWEEQSFTTFRETRCFTNKFCATAKGKPGMLIFSPDNPVFVTYMIAASIMILKIMGQGWMTVYRMLKSDSGLVTPEDLRTGLINRNPVPEQLEVNDYVDRSRRMHRNDLENIPAFLMAGLLFVASGPSILLANFLMYGFVVSRLLHSMAYATKQSHEVRATLYTVGSLIVIAMALIVLSSAIFGS